MNSNFAIPTPINTSNLDVLLLNLQNFKNPLLITSNTNLLWIKENLKTLYKSEENILIINSHEGFSSQIEKLKKLKKLKKEKVDALICLGGGSVLDFGKIIRSFISTGLEYDFRNSEIPSFINFLDSNQKHANFPYLVSIPTTTGTGSEVTPFSTIWDYEKKLKFSFDCRFQASDKIFFIPELTKSLNKEVRLSTLLDALSHGFESLWSKKSNLISELYANFAIHSILELLNKDFSTWQDSDYQEAMYSAYLSGLAISFTKTGVCHSLSYPLTLNYGVLHGLACSFSLPFVLKKIYIEEKGINFNFRHNSKFKDLSELSIYMDALFARLRINNLISSKLADKEIANVLISSFRLNDRSNNSIIDLTDRDILLISKSLC